MGEVKISVPSVEEQLVTRQYFDERLKELEYRLVIHLGGMIETLEKFLGKK